MCVTDDEILKELKLKEFDKAEVEKEKRVRERAKEKTERRKATGSRMEGRAVSENAKT